MCVSVITEPWYSYDTFVRDSLRCCLTTSPAALVRFVYSSSTAFIARITYLATSLSYADSPLNILCSTSTEESGLYRLFICLSFWE